MESAVHVPINHLQHTGIPVTDIKRSESFYQKLGFTNVMQSVFQMDGETGTCVMMQNGKTIIELYQMPDQHLAGVRARRDGHIDHIAFDVDDIDAAFAALKGAEFAVIEDAPVFLNFWHKGCRYFNITGPDGERLEFNQML